MKTWKDLLDHFAGTEVEEELLKVTNSDGEPTSSWDELNEPTETLSQVLDFTPHWFNTPQGFSYWNGVFDKLYDQGL